MLSLTKAKKQKEPQATTTGCFPREISTTSMNFIRVNLASSTNSVHFLCECVKAFFFIITLWFLKSFSSIFLLFNDGFPLCAVSLQDLFDHGFPQLPFIFISLLSLFILDLSCTYTCSLGRLLIIFPLHFLSLIGLVSVKFP